VIALVINLARAPERWSSMARQAAERGLAIERLEAVDGRDPAALAASAAAPGNRLSPGEIACFESHRAAWRRIADGDAPFGLVLEDDVFLAPALADVLAGLPRAAGGLDIVKLNAHPRGMLVRTAPLARVAGRALVRPAQGTSDSSAYVISRGFAARALAIHTGYTLPLDLALFDPATCPAIAQLDPAVTVQQRYAGFRFLDEAAPKTSIQPDRAAAARPRSDPLTAARREAARVWRRRLLPAAQPLLNLARAAVDRQDFRRIAFDG
jgi:glycosyl transferase family 25